MNRNKGIRFFVDTIQPRDSSSSFFFFNWKEKETNKEPPKNLRAHIFIHSLISFGTSYIVSMSELS